MTITRFCNKNVIFSLVLGALLLSLPETILAESQIYLKDGRKIEVDSFWREEGMVKYESFGGIVGIPMDDVDRIVTPDILAFQETREINTIEAYEIFLEKYSKSKFAPEAEQRMTELQYEEVKNINSAPVYLDYIRRNPNSLFIEEAKERAEILIFQDAVRDGQVKKFEEYIEIYPEGNYADATLKAVEVIKYRAVKKSDTVPDIQAYLREYPESVHRQAFEDRVADLNAQAKARTKAQRERQEKARKLKELEAAKKHKFWTTIGYSAGGVTFLVLAVFVFINVRRRFLFARWKKGDETEVPESADTGGTSATQGPVRYEDLIGVSRSDENDGLSLPEPGKSGDLEPEFLISLPGPGETPQGGGAQEEGKPGEDNDAIIIGYGNEAPPSEDERSGSENKVDSSNQETHIKLELEDAPQENHEAQSERRSSADEIDLSDGDMSGLLSDEAKHKRRGGGL